MQYVDTSISTLRKDLTECLKQVGSGDVSLVIKRRQKPFAILSRFKENPPQGEEYIECSASQVRPEISDLVNRVFYNNVNIIIKKNHLSVAIIKPLEEAGVEGDSDR